MLAAVTAPQPPHVEPTQHRISLYCFADHLVCAVPEPHTPGMMELATLSAATLRDRLQEMTGDDTT